jgi:hypothetical protein
MTLPNGSLDLPPFFVPYPGALLTSDHIATYIRYDVKRMTDLDVNLHPALPGGVRSSPI